MEPDKPKIKFPQRDAKKDYAPDSFQLQFAESLFVFVLEVAPGTYNRYLPHREAVNTVIQNSANQINLLMIKDGKKEAQINAVFAYVKESDFWRTNIRSGATFREKFGVLELQMKEQNLETLESEVDNPDERLTQKIVGIYRALLDNPDYHYSSKSLPKFIMATEKVKHFAAIRELSTSQVIGYLLDCLQKTYQEKGDVIFPGHLCSDHTWDILMPQYLQELGLYRISSNG